MQAGIFNTLQIALYIIFHIFLKTSQLIRLSRAIPPPSSSMCAVWWSMTDVTSCFFCRSEDLAEMWRENVTQNLSISNSVGTMKTISSCCQEIKDNNKLLSWRYNFVECLYMLYVKERVDGTGYFVPKRSLIVLGGQHKISSPFALGFMNIAQLTKDFAKCYSLEKQFLTAMH